jgi:putative hydrolase of the HAD superfamily
MAGLVNSPVEPVDFSGVRAVLFDAVGTLIRPEPPVPVAYEQIGRQFGSELSQTEIHSRFVRAFARQEQQDVTVHGLKTSESRERERWQQIVADVLDDVTDQAALFAALWEHFADARHWRLFDDAAQWLTKRKQSAVPVGIASNFDARLEGIVASMPRLALLQPRLFLSTRLGWRKPHVNFFRGIEQQLGLAPSELLFVGDHPEHDARAAREAGWRAVLVCREGPSHLQAGESPGDSIRDLAEFLLDR